MVVDAHRARQEDLDLAAQGGGDQAVQERVVDGGVGAEQELALGAAAGDEIELAGKDLARSMAVARARSRPRASARFHGLGAKSVRWSAIVSEIRTRMASQLTSEGLWGAPCAPR